MSDVVLFPSHDVSSQSPSCLHDDGLHAVLVASYMKFMIEDCVWREYVF